MSFFEVSPANPGDPQDVRVAEFAQKLLDAQGDDFWRYALRQGIRGATPADVARQWLIEQEKRSS